MKANELKIGNLIHCVLLGTSKVLELRNDGISICNPNNDLNAYFIPNKDLHRIEPIPLTEEWLLRLGFIEYDRMRDLKFFNYKDNLDDRYWNICLSESECLFAFNHLTWDDSFKIKSVNQLQNLYFALTGQELKFDG